MTAGRAGADDPASRVGLSRARPGRIGTAGTAAYVGYAQEAGWGVTQSHSGVPTAAIVFAHDVGIRRYAEQENTITRWVDVDEGGHFAALEQPDMLTADIREFFRDLR